MNFVEESKLKMIYQFLFFKIVCNCSLKTSFILYKILKTWLFIFCDFIVPLFKQKYDLIFNMFEKCTLHTLIKHTVCIL